MDEKKELIEKMIQRVPNGKLSCTEARHLADELGIALSDMGELCDEAKIKINACELGCF